MKKMRVKNYIFNKRINWSKHFVFICFRLFLFCLFAIAGYGFLPDMGNFCSVRVSAAELSEVIQSGDWSYCLDENDKVTIVGYFGNDSEIVIDQIDGKDVVAISDNAFAARHIEKITLPEGLEQIGKDAFYGCGSLKSVELPSSLIAIGKSAFAYCNYLTSIELPANLQYIGEDAFLFCHNLVYIGLEESNPYFVKKKGIIYDKNCASVYFVSKNELPSSVILPDTVTRIENSAFYYCEGFVSIQLPEGLQYIGNYAFEYCGRLRSIDLPDGLKQIGDCAFAYSVMQEFTLPESVTEIGVSILSSSCDLEKVTVKAPLTDLKKMCEHCGSLQEIILPEELKVLNGFSGCCSIKRLDIPDGVEIIEDGSFWGGGLESLQIPAGVQKIEEGAIWNCVDLSEIQVSPDNPHFYVESGMLFSEEHVLLAITNQVEGDVEIPDNCSRIGENAFYLNETITKVVLPASLSEIGLQAFAKCSALSEIHVGNGITRIGSGAFWDTAYFHDDANWEDGVFYLGQYALSVADEQKKIITIKDGITLLGDCFCVQSDGLEAVILPDSVEYIGEAAFWICPELKKLMGGKNVKWIGENAFDGDSSLSSLYLQGESVTIEKNAFGECYGLKYVWIDAKQAELAAGCFEGCFGMQCLVLPELNRTFTELVGDIWVTAWDDLVLVLTQEEQSGQHLCAFFIDEWLGRLDVVEDGGEMPANEFSDAYYSVTSDGPVYCNMAWDLDQDGMAEELPQTVTQDIKADAVYQVLEETHSWETVAVLLERSCTTEEVRECRCTGCGETRRFIAEELGHAFSNEWTVDVAATCTGTGIKSHHCTREGCEEKDSVTVILPVGHSWDEGMVAKAPEIGIAGEIVYTCLACGETRTEELEALAPTPTPIPTPTPTLTPIPTTAATPTSAPVVSPSLYPSPTATLTEAPEETYLPEVSPVPGTTATPGEMVTATPDITATPDGATVPPTENLETTEPDGSSASGTGSGTDAGEQGDTVGGNDGIQVSLRIQKKHTVLLQWSSNRSCRYFQIYRSTKKKNGYRKLKQISGAKSSYVDQTVLADRKYYYQIKGIAGEVATTDTVIASGIASIKVPLQQAPQIALTKGRTAQNVSYISIQLKKYWGERVEIQYRKGSGQFRNIALRSNTIKKMKKGFRVKYLSGGEMLSIRVRTYSVTGQKKEYSKWSKVKKVII